jgi:hypothetical protein|tara:strand:- start:303 stop:506 length:204 start_codon:yes stop_codon:yes gene_type:complete
MVIENNLRLDNKTIIVTGTSGHIESSISSSLSMLGADLSKWLASPLAPKSELTLSPSGIFRNQEKSL